MENHYAIYLKQRKETFIIKKNNDYNVYRLVYGCKRMEMVASGCLRKCYSLFVWKKSNVSDILDILGSDDFVKTCLDKTSNFDVVLFGAINRCGLCIV